MTSHLLMLDLVRTLYWFDEQLQSRLEALGWGRLGRSQSLILANVANGETRASRMADNLGVSRQAMSQFLTELSERKLIEIVPDPQDRRARIVRFAPESESIREDARRVLTDMETELENSLGPRDMRTLRDGLRKFLGNVDQANSQFN